MTPRPRRSTLLYHTFLLENLLTLQQCSWGTPTSGIWHGVCGWLVPDVSRKRREPNNQWRGHIPEVRIPRLLPVTSLLCQMCVQNTLHGFFFVVLRPNAGHGLLILEVFLDHTQRRTTVGRTPLDEWSARRRDLYLTTQNNHNRQTSMPPVGFEPTISAGERPQSYALDRAAAGTGSRDPIPLQKKKQH